MHRSIALGLAALALASAAGVRAGDPAPPAAATGASSASSAVQFVDVSASAAARQQHCRKEYRVGSNFPVTTCDSQEESEVDRQARIRTLQDAARRNTNTMKPPG